MFRFQGTRVPCTMKLGSSRPRLTAAWAQVHTLAGLTERLKAVYRAMTGGKFTEGLRLVNLLLLLIPLTVVETRREVDELKELLTISRYGSGTTAILQLLQFDTRAVLPPFRWGLMSSRSCSPLPGMPLEPLLQQTVTHAVLQVRLEGWTCAEHLCWPRDDCWQRDDSTSCKPGCHSPALQEVEVQACPGGMLWPACEAQPCRQPLCSQQQQDCPRGTAAGPGGQGLGGRVRLRSKQS